MMVSYLEDSPFENTNFDPNKGKTEEIKFAFTS